MKPRKRARSGNPILSVIKVFETRNIHSARDRIRHFLAINAGPGGRTVSLSGTLRDIAAELGLTHEALYRTLADMSAEGEIERRNTLIRLKKSVI